MPRWGAAPGACPKPRSARSVTSPMMLLQLGGRATPAPPDAPSIWSAPVATESAVTHDRIAGALIGAAAGDALGAPYEFTHPGPDVVIEPRGGGAFGWESGEWTDDTDLTVCVAYGLIHGDVLEATGLDDIAARFRAWLEQRPKDVGRQTKLAILHGGDTAAAMTAFVESRADTHSGGNGSLMRTAPVALRYLDDPAACVEAARRISALTHPDSQAGIPCAMWSYAIRHAIVYGDINGPLHYLEEFADPAESAFWSRTLTDAAAGEPARDFRNNGWVVHALQTAWWAISTTPGSGEDHLAAALERCVRAGGDTDTTAAIAGALLGARWGASAVPDAWRAQLHGYPGLDGDDLGELGLAVAQAATP